MNPFIEISLLFILPTFLFVAHIFPLKYRVVGLTLVSLLGVVAVFLHHYSFFNLGIRVDNIKDIFVPYLIVTFLSVIFIFFMARLYGRKFIPSWKIYEDALFWVFFGSVFQEFLFRSYLMLLLGSIFSSIFLVVIFDTILFTLVHFIYPDLRVDAPFIFIGGLMFAVMYYIYPNLFIISIMHMVLNFTACSYGFFTLKPEMHKIVNI